MKKGLLLIVSFVLIFTLFGCGNNNNNASENNAPANEPAANNGGNAAADEPAAKEVEISISTWGNDDERKVFETVLADFKAANPNIKVKLIHIPADYATKMNTMIAGGTAPDVIFTSDGDFPRWVKQGAFLNIDEYVNASTKLDLNDMWETGLKRYKYDGAKLGEGAFYGLPKDVGPTVMVYNKDLFTKLGVPFPSADNPMTWDQALEMWKSLTVDENGDGKTDIYGAGPIWWEGYVWSNGGDMLSEDRTTFTLAEDKGAQAMDFVRELTSVHKVVPNGKALQSMNDGQMFEAGKLATITAGRWMVPTYRKLKFDWDVAPIPSADGSWKNGWSGSAGLAVSAKTKYPAEAFKLVEWFAGIEGQTKMTELGFSIPNFKSMANTDLFLQPGQKPENAQVYLKEAENEPAGPWTWLPNSKWHEVLGQNLQKFWDGKTPAAQYFGDLKPQIEKALKEGNPELFK